jgi:hypothetical protein
MSAPILANRSSWDLALKEIWSEYRTWAKTAGDYKTSVTSWRNAILILSILGAILGTLSQNLSLWGLQADSWWPPAVGIFSGATLGLASFFARSALSPDSEANAARARSAAEAFKSEGYLLAAQAPPYDTATTTAELRERTDRIKKAVDKIPHKTISSTEATRGIPTEPLSIDDYIKRRVDDQIDGYYLPRAREYERKTEKAKYLTLALGAIAFLLGLGSTKFGWIPGWIAVIGTLTSAIAARQYAGRYQFLVLNYQAAAEKLRSLKTDRGINRVVDPDGVDKKFIVACEEAISSENTAWMAEFTKKPTP